MLNRLILASLLLASPLLAQTNYYVRTDGNDANNGLANTTGGAWKTITHACSALVLGASGTTVNVASGTYTGGVNCSRSGTSTQPLKFISTTRWGAKITNNASGATIWSETGDYNTIQDFDLAGNGVNNTINGTLHGVVLHGQRNRVVGNHVHNIDNPTCNQQLHVSAQGIDSDANAGNYAASGHNEVTGNVVHDIGWPNSSSVGNVGCNGSEGIYFGTPYGTAFNNIVYRIGQDGIHAGHAANHETFANNTIFNVSFATNGTFIGACMTIGPGDVGATTDSGSTIINNICRTMDAFPIMKQGPADGTSITNKTLMFTMGTNNVFCNASNCTGFSNGQPPAGSLAANPLMVNFNANPGQPTISGTTGLVVWPDADYHLASTSSPAVNFGVSTGATGGTPSGGNPPFVPSVDFDNQPRPASGAQTAGAYVFAASGVPLVSFSPSPLSYGAVPVSTSITLSTTLTNIGNGNLTFTTPAAISGTNAGDFVIVTTTCASPLVATASCRYDIRFTPSASGTRTANLTLTDNAAPGSHQVPLTGIGGVPGISLNPTSLSFGLIAPGSCSAAQLDTVTSSGDADLVITSVFTFSNPQFAFVTGGNCSVGQTLPKGTSCVVNIRFCPTTTGAVSANLSMPTNAPGSPKLLPLSGTGGTSAATFLPATFAYGNQQVGTSSAAHTFVYSNTGSLALNITSVGNNSSSYTVTDNCPRAPSTLAVATACNVNVVFKPINTGPLSAIVTVTGDATQTATVSGTGTQANITITPVTFNFGSVLVGDVSSDQTFIINNTGTASANIGSVTAAAPFSVASTSCGATLASNTTCNAVARFTPTVVGLVAGQLVVADNAPGNPHTAALTGTGTSAGVTILPATLAFGNQAVGTVSTPRTTIVTNTGSGSLTGPGIVINNLDQVTTLWPPTGWKPVCILPACNPGGSGTPTATSQTFNNATPSIDGASMKVSLTGPAFTNALWVYAAGGDDSVLNMTSDFWTQPSANSAVLGSLEFDQAIFNKTLGINFMFGTQCNQASNKWQVWDQLNTAWVNVVGSTCTALTPGTFHHIIQQVHRVEGDLTGCSGQPCMYFDSITVDGVAVPGLPMTEPAGPLNPTFNSGVIWQVQLDIGSTGSAGSPVFENIDKLNFSFNSVNFTGANPTDFSQTNTCPQSIASGGSCPINVTFTPGAAGPRSATMSVATNAASSPTLVALTGTGTTIAPAVCLDRSSINFGNQPVGTTSGTQPVKITNCGTDNLIVLAPTPSANFTASTSCGTIAPLATCNVNIAFAPSAAGTLTGTVNINSNAVSSPNVVTVQGFGTQTGATLTPTSVNFGTITLGQSSAPTSLLLTNTSNIAISPLTPTRGGSNPLDFTSGQCPTSLAANATCRYDVAFAPTIAGARSSTLTQTFNNISTVLTVALSGTGQATAPAVTLIPTSINFGSVTQGVSTPSQNIQLTNSGSDTLNVTSVTATGANLADVTLSADHCSGTAVAPGGVCLVTVAMTPGGLGARSANAHYITDAISSPDNVTLAVIGLAAAAPQATFSANTLAFGNIKTGQTSAAQTITVGNIGDGNLIVSSVTLTGANPTQYTQSNNCATVIPNLSCTVTVNFKPTSTGAKPTSLTIASNDPTTPSKVITLTGTGKGKPNAVIGATKISFGATTVGTTSGPAAFTITNTGDDTLNVASITTTGDLFPQTNSCVCCPVAPGDSCAITVQFNPQILCGQFTETEPITCVSNVHPGITTIVTDADTTTQTVALEGLAIPVPIPPGPIIISVGGAAQVGGVLRIGYDAAAPVACNGYGNNGYGGSGGCGYGQ